MIYKFQTSRSIWKSKAYKSYLWAFFKNDCLLFKHFLLLSLWIVRQTGESIFSSSLLSLSVRSNSSFLLPCLSWSFQMFFSFFSFLPTCVLLVTKKNDSPVCFFLPFFICIILIFIFIFYFLKSRWFREVTTLWPILLIYYFF